MCGLWKGLAAMRHFTRNILWLSDAMTSLKWRLSKHFAFAIVSDDIGPQCCITAVQTSVVVERQTFAPYLNSFYCNAVVQRQQTSLTHQPSEQNIQRRHFWGRYWQEQEKEAQTFKQLQVVENERGGRVGGRGLVVSLWRLESDFLCGCDWESRGTHREPASVWRCQMTGCCWTARWAGLWLVIKNAFYETISCVNLL